MGHRDSVDPSKMAIEGSSTFASEDSSNTSASPTLQESGNDVDTEENLDDEQPAATGMKRKATDKSAKSARKGKKRRDEQQTEWQTSFLQLMERSLEQDSIRFERSTEMLRESQRNQMEQTNAILAGFKDIFKDLTSK